jgi:hypothetical protein
MAYIGNSSPSRFVSNRTKTAFSGNGILVDFTLEQAVVQPEDVLVSVDGVIQEPTVAYGIINGTTLRFTEAPSSNAGNNIFVYYLASQVGTVGPPNDSVSTDTLKNSAVNLTSKVTGVLPYANGGNQTASLAAYKWGALDQDDANTTIPSSSIMVNVGSDLASSGVYTCPVDGVYRATIWGMAGGDGSNSQSSIFSCYLSLNDAFPSDDQYSIYVSTATTYSQFSANFLITCSATNTLRWGIQANRRTLHASHGQATFKLEHQT